VSQREREERWGSFSRKKRGEGGRRNVSENAKEEWRGDDERVERRWRRKEGECEGGREGGREGGEGFCRVYGVNQHI